MAVGAIAAIGAACVPYTPPPPPPPTVIVYGDSLTSESRTYINDRITAARPGWRVLNRDYPGTALCDWFEEMEADGDENAQLVVLQFSGNTNPCMSNHAPNTPLWLTRYTADTDEAVSLWEARGVHVLIVNSPLSANEDVSKLPSVLDAAYQDVADAHPGAATFSSAPGEAVSEADPDIPGQRFYMFEMPCIPEDIGPATGCGELTPDFAAVRDSVTDPLPGPGGHFCRHSGVWPCDVYSSGVTRYGGAIADAAVALMA
jgi:hypothetical protein